MILNAWRMATALRREWRRLLPTQAHRTCPLFSLEHAYCCCPHTPTAHAHCSPSNMPTVASRTCPPDMPTVLPRTCLLLLPHMPTGQAHRSPSNMPTVAPAHAHRTGPPSPSNMPTVAAHTGPPHMPTVLPRTCLLLLPTHLQSCSPHIPALIPAPWRICSSHMPTVVRYVAVYLSHLDSNRSHFASPFYLFLSFAPGAIFLGR